MEQLQTLAAAPEAIDISMRGTTVEELASMATASAITALETLARPAEELIDTKAVIGDIGFPTWTMGGDTD